MGNSNCEVQTCTIANTDGDVCFHSSWDKGRLQKPVLCAGPRFSPVTMNEGPLPEAQKLNDFPWTVESLVVPTAKKSGNSIVALALYEKGKRTRFCLSVLTWSPLPA